MARIIDWIMGSRLARWVGLALAFLLAWAGYGHSKRRQGRDEAMAEIEARRNEDTIKAMEARRDVESIVRNSGDGTAADRLRDEWSRD